MLHYQSHLLNRRIDVRSNVVEREDKCSNNEATALLNCFVEVKISHGFLH